MVQATLWMRNAKNREKVRSFEKLIFAPENTLSRYNRVNSIKEKYKLNKNINSSSMLFHMKNIEILIS